MAAAGKGAVDGPRLSLQCSRLSREKKSVLYGFGEPALTRQTANRNVSVSAARERVCAPIMMKDGLELVAKLGLRHAHNRTQRPQGFSQDCGLVRSPQAFGFRAAYPPVSRLECGCVHQVGKV
jgi:hypothetical protein